MQNQRSAHELEDGTPQDEQPDRPAKKLRLESPPSQPSSPKSESTAESDIDNEDDLVLSEVHIDPRNGRADGRLMTSTFNLGPESSILGDGDSADKLEDELEDEDDHGSWKYSVEIQHAMGTPLKDVGTQVWMGCFLLIDWLVSIKDQLDGNVALELGAGTGLGSIACGLLTNVAKVFCTDHGMEVLSNCEQSISLNRHLIPGDNDRVLPRWLNWLMPDPMDSAEPTDRFGWTLEEREEWRRNGSFVIAADVVYDDSLTDALVETLEKLLAEPLPENHQLHTTGRVAYLTMEKRYNFSLDQLDVVAQAHDYFVNRMKRSDVLMADPIDCSQLARWCDYDRSKDLQLFRVQLKRPNHVTTDPTNLGGELD
ncbi:hypothetical protein B0O80DRAFT_2503 [Mortierella sp. GBAus27b]|nr:hypothetical protein B0O80DRAFT_2503 [Mortierella sp. GBAus27b]